MSYLLGWAVVLAIAAAVALILRKVGPPGAEGPDRRSAGKACCNRPPEPPGSAPARRRRPL